MTKLSIIALKLVTRITIIKKCMIGMRAMIHHFYLELICQNCFTHSVLEPWMEPFYGSSKFVLTLYFCKPLLVIVQENRSRRNIKL